jgi:hypothetical protein
VLVQQTPVQPTPVPVREKSTVAQQPVKEPRSVSSSSEEDSSSVQSSSLSESGSEEEATSESEEDSSENEEDPSSESEEESSLQSSSEEEPVTKGDILNLEDKLDALMAEFDEMINGIDHEDAESEGPEAGSEGPEAGSEEHEAGSEEQEDDMMEAISLKPAPKPVTAEEGNTNKQSTYAANSGAKGMAARPVKTGSDAGGKHDSSAYKNAVKEIGTPSTQDAARGAFKSAAPKATTSEPAGVNKRSITK